MKLTRHNGHSGKHGTYNPRHNDRWFDVENSEHIDAERARQNVYWDCYRGFTTHEFRENPEQSDFSFEEIERMYYYEDYGGHVETQNARNEKTRHTERNRTVEDLLKNNKTCPEESIYQIGTMGESVPPDTLFSIVNEFYEEFERRFGSHIHILDWALHLDESTPHIHERHVFDCENKYGELFPQQEKALEALGFELPEPEKIAEPLNKRKVLIIEDDNDIREFLKEEVGVYFEVEVAADGTAGFEKARTYDADLIICDVLMPGMTGFEVTKKLKSDFATSHIPIILLTALNSPEKHLEGIESGADAYIAKPFSIKLLLARVFRLIEQRDKLREKFSSEPGIVRAAVCSTDRDKEFADRLAAVLEQNLSRPEFSIDEFAQLMKLGRTVFYRKLRGVTGYSPNEYLRVVRMKKAAELLLSGENLTVAEVSYKVGISDPFYFSKCFKTQFGVAPSVYQRGEMKEQGDNEAAEER